MPDPQKMLATLRRATDLFLATPGREGAVIRLPDSAEEVLVVGDLHGNIPFFRHVLNRADLSNQPGRHLVLQELVHGKYHYPDDGGDRSHQLVDLVAALKCQCPDRVHLILGNHELSELTGRPIGKDGVMLNALFQRGLETAYGTMAEAVRKAYLKLFRSLPLVVRTPNRVLLCHTIPEGHLIDQLDQEILRTGVWTPESMTRNGTVYALTWGRDNSLETVDRFAKWFDVELFITGHQPCDEGSLRPNPRQIIIDGTDPYPTYCLFPARGPIDIDRLAEGVHTLSIQG
ncbi:metallophosphoesterase [soil metagenome]